ncbi:MAG: N-acetylmuramoyl-L-alanine amidase [Actinomycetia bacterium]|nr:N-acetylmuramoyl-L-alanine amidase [Actinomycetes bacterium]
MIQRFQARRKRRRSFRFALGSLAGAVIVALVATGVVLAVRSPADEDVSSSAAAAGVSTTKPEVTTTPSSTSTARSTAASQSTTTSPAAPTAAPPPSVTPSPPTAATSLPSAGSPPTAATSSATTTSPVGPGASGSPSPSTVPRAGKVVVIDPGHQADGNPATEPVGPGSSDYKAKVSSGTSGVATGTPESELVLAVALKLRDALLAHGIEVVMTRTTEDGDLSNIERAQIANSAGADLFVRIHADGSDDAATSGIHVLYPASIKGWTDDIAAASKEAAALAQRELIAATGAVDRGLDARSDMTGFNWSDVPVILPEIGFMTNPAEDRLLATTAYQDKIVAGLVRAILAFLGVG